MDNIEKLKQSLDKHEALKAKGLRLSNQDIHDWLWVYDTMIDLSVEFESEREENKAQLDNIMDSKHILLKEQEGWSDTVIKAKVKDIYKHDVMKLWILKKYKTLSKLKLSSIEHYINFAKKIVFNN